MSKGRLIVFEGIDGSGKTTQLRLAAEWLEAHTDQGVVCTREPGGTWLGLKIRELLTVPMPVQEPVDLLAELMLFAGDRAQHVATVIEPALTAGKIVLCDRFTASTVAYQGYGRGLDLKVINQLNEIATGGLRPDLAVWLDCDPALAAERLNGRGGKNRIDTESLEFMKRVRKGYCREVFNDDNSVAVGSCKPIDETASLVKEVLVAWLRYWNLGEDR